VNASGVGEGGWEGVAAADCAAAGGGEGWAAGGGEDNLALIGYHREREATARLG
jgi:hypothetical protein